MKILKVLAASLLACAALVLSSCEKGVTNTGDFSGNLYGVWQLDHKTVDRETIKDTDFNGEHFYLAILPLVAFAKKGALSALDFKIDVDATFCTYNDVDHQIYFKETQALYHGLNQVMYLKGTYDVLELSKDKLVISKTVGKSTTTYYYHKLFQQEEIENN